MMPLDAWLKLCKVMKEDEIYPLKTFTILGHPSLAFYAKRDRFDNLIFYGEPKMGGLKLAEPIVMGKKEFTALFPLIDHFIVKQQDFLEADEFVEEKPKEEEEVNVQSHEDDHLRAKNRNNNNNK